MSDRAILHSDANGFYASVEMVLNPELRGKAVAVCGSIKERHGIVLAKSELAKKAGIKTGMVAWQARQLCPELIVVPPHYDYYVKFSKMIQKIYARYTDEIEPFGMDECWLDVTRSPMKPMEIAECIRREVREELALTVSIGVSFNKVFAKLASDMKKPDAITEITRENFKEKVWPLPCSDMIYCGRATTNKLESIGVQTIGQLANLNPDVLKHKLGKNGVMLWQFANGLDTSRVAHESYSAPAKSVGHGITCTEDLNTLDEAQKIIYALSQDIGAKLRQMGLRAKGVHLSVRDNELHTVGWQTLLKTPTQDELDIANEAFAILLSNYRWEKNVRSLTVTAINLEKVEEPIQLSLFDTPANEKREILTRTIDEIHELYGKHSLVPALILDEKKMPRGVCDELVMPGWMYV
ncbi:MAG: DNA polymerase IV [Clostridia bacterium]|nr:DNA polymerase IV [Clostridia bacterium]